ncbi:HPr kinase/phosphorylase [uncultured Sphingomonas sp.]|uniref:HPr kinase/phosphorylase n=1 Tax=uncultured Sphingomonas sp. TaxID=158754 RepID=UPI0035CC56DD
MSDTIHATTIAIGGCGVVISGPSGSGKSDLALRLIDRGAVLVADDRTRVWRDGDRLFAGVPDAIPGKLEVRGLGILEVSRVPEVPVALCVDLVAKVERMPFPRTRTIAGIVVPELAVDPRPASAAIKVELALLHRDRMSA